MTKDRSEERSAVLSTVIGALFERSGAGVRAQIGEWLPTVPAAKVLGLDGAAFERGGRRARQRVTDGHDPDRGEVVWDFQGRPDQVHALRVWEGPSEPRGEAFVDRRQDDQHHGATDVHPPVGNRPDQLLAVFQLVGLLVTLVVEPLADTRNELGTALADPAVVADVRVALFVGPLGDLRHERRVGDDHQTLTWLKPALGARSAARAIRS